MTEDQLEKMRECARRRQNSAKTVRVACKDGDVLQGSAVFVSDAERDVIYASLGGGSLAEPQPPKRQCNQKSQEDNAQGPEAVPDGPAQACY